MFQIFAYFWEESSQIKKIIYMFQICVQLGNSRLVGYLGARFNFTLLHKLILEQRWLATIAWALGTRRTKN
jgi:hypothetical protein